MAMERNSPVCLEDDMDGSCIKEALNRFQGVRNPKIRWLMWHLAFVLLFGVALALIFTRDRYITYVSMILAVALSLFAFEELIRSIPKALGDLWYQGLLAEKSLGESVGGRPLNLDSNSVASLEENISSNAEALPKNDAEFEDQFFNFIKSIEDSLNRPIMQFLFGSSFLVVLLSRSIYEFWKWLPNDFSSGLIYKAGGYDALFEGIKLHSTVYLVEYSIAEPFKFWTGILLEPFLGSILGLVAWRMFVTARYIDKLGQSFDLTPKLEHPDRSGGLGSLGKLSLINALIIGIWGTFLGGWIVLGSITKYGEFYVPLYKVLLALPVVMSIICFFSPLWNIHIKMTKIKDESRKECCKIGSNIDILARRRLSSALLMKNEDTEADKHIDEMKRVYEGYKNRPVWPFNYKIFLAFITSQIVPLLGLTGLATPIVNVVGSLMEFISQLTGR